MEVPELKASLDTIRRAASDLIIKIDEKVAELTNTQEKSKGDDFMDIDNWLKEHGDELPFDNPEAGLPIGFIKIEPPVDFSDYQTDRPIKISREEPAEEKKKEAKPEKKPSVKEKLQAEKVKTQKTKTTKKDPKKDLQEAI